MKKVFLRNFAIFTGKDLCKNLFCNNVAGLIKEALAQVFSCGFCEISKNTFFHWTSLVVASETYNNLQHFDNDTNVQVDNERTGQNKSNTRQTSVKVKMFKQKMNKFYLHRNYFTIHNSLYNNLICKSKSKSFKIYRTTILLRIISRFNF